MVRASSAYVGGDVPWDFGDRDKLDARFLIDDAISAAAGSEALEFDRLPVYESAKAAVESAVAGYRRATG